MFNSRVLVISDNTQQYSRVKYLCQADFADFKNGCGASKGPYFTGSGMILQLTAFSGLLITGFMAKRKGFTWAREATNAYSTTLDG